MSNPYEAPQSPIYQPPPINGVPLASLGQRFGAAFLDGLIMWIPGYFLGKLLFTPPSKEQMMQWAEEGKNVIELTKLASPSIGTSLLAAVIQVVVFIAINYVFLQKGQTIGKKALGIQVWRRDSDEILPFQENLTRRVIPYFMAGTVLSAIHPFLAVVVLIDILCIFRKDRNTLHDDLAKSRVVKL